MALFRRPARQLGPECRFSAREEALRLGEEGQMPFWLVKVPGRLSGDEVRSTLEGLPGFKPGVEIIVENSEDGTVVAVRGCDPDESGRGLTTDALTAVIGLSAKQLFNGARRQ